jgi:hypothetical protein
MSRRRRKSSSVGALSGTSVIATHRSFSYLHSLRQKTASIREEISQFRNHNNTTHLIGDDPLAEPCSKRCYHFEIAVEDGLPSIKRIAYLGPDSSARLLLNLRKDVARWYTMSDIQLPQSLRPTYPTAQLEMLGLRRPSTFPLNSDIRKAEFHMLVPPLTQLAIIEHHL